MLKHRFPRLRLVISFTLLVVFISNGCNPSAAVNEKEFDSLVDDVWLADGSAQLKDAEEYLGAGGKHHDVDGRTQVDRDHVLPLVRRLKKEFQVKCHAVIFDDDTRTFASEILVRLPADSSTRSKIKQMIDAADAKYPGSIKQQWGRKWLGISFRPAN